jgi:hypothetical protein
VKELAGKPIALIGVNVNAYDAKQLKAVMVKENLNWRSTADRGAICCVVPGRIEWTGHNANRLGSRSNLCDVPCSPSQPSQPVFHGPAPGVPTFRESQVTTQRRMFRKNSLGGAGDLASN